MRSQIHIQILALLGLLAVFTNAVAENGYDLWLRYERVTAPILSDYRESVTAIVASGDSATIVATVDELVSGISAMLGQEVLRTSTVERHGTIVLGTPENSRTIRALDPPLDQVGDEGFVIRSGISDNKRIIAIAANTDTGVLYGMFELLRRMQMQSPIDNLDIVSSPSMNLRLLNHWDNLSGFVERGYAGASLWDWHRLPAHKDARYQDYARANASLGINGTVLNNVNANAQILQPAYIAKVAAIADVMRPYGIKVYLSARFSAPVEIGGLETADPLHADVRQWWRDKSDDIYELIPDFGGFLVKANSEGQPGPQDYDRSHADGANMLADAVAPHGGIVMWRAFVYSAETPVDRIKQAYDEFVPLDGTFRPNVLVQVKNGPLDFQPREPFHPLFGAAPQTPLMMEFQITKEYLGFASHLAYLGTLWEEVLESDTYAQGSGSIVTKVIDGSLNGHQLTGIAGVTNIGADTNWSGSVFSQSNWYAFGRLAWDPGMSALELADEWVRQTFSNDPEFITPVVGMMMGSREAVVNYMTPLGLTHLMATGHHYGPGPWVNDLGRDDWNPVYYHRADKDGIGFDRTQSGSDAAHQYHEPLASQFDSLATTPEELLLWFHHVPWNYKMKSGATIWEALIAHYQQGIDSVANMRTTWSELAPYIDAERFAETEVFLAIQQQEAQWWRDASVAYFQSVSGLPLPDGATPPPQSLEYYKAIHFPHLEGF